MSKERDAQDARRVNIRELVDWLEASPAWAESHANWTDFPKEAFIHVLNHIPPNQWKNLLLSNKRFHRIYQVLNEACRLNFMNDFPRGYKFQRKKALRRNPLEADNWIVKLQKRERTEYEGLNSAQIQFMRELKSQRRDPKRCLAMLEELEQNQNGARQFALLKTVHLFDWCWESQRPLEQAFLDRYFVLAQPNCINNDGSVNEARLLALAIYTRQEAPVMEILKKARVENASKLFDIFALQNGLRYCSGHVIPLLLEKFTPKEIRSAFNEYCKKRDDPRLVEIIMQFRDQQKDESKYLTNKRLLKIAFLRDCPRALEVILNRGVKSKKTEGNITVEEIFQGACVEGKEEIVRYFWDRIPAEKRAELGLMAACENNRARIVSLFMQDPEFLRSNHLAYNGFEVACKRGWGEVADVILARFPDFCKTVTMAISRYGFHHFVVEACENGCLDVLKVLVKYQAKLTRAIEPPFLRISVSEDNPLRAALLHRHYHVAKYLLSPETGHEPLDSQQISQALFFLAGCAPGREELTFIQWMLARDDIDPNVRNDRDKIPLHNIQSESILKLFLLRPELELDVRDREGRTPLYECMRKHDNDCVALLLRHGAEIDQKTYEDTMPHQREILIKEINRRCRVELERISDPDIQAKVLAHFEAVKEMIAENSYGKQGSEHFLQSVSALVNFLNGVLTKDISYENFLSKIISVQESGQALAAAKIFHEAKLLRDVKKAAGRKFSVKFSLSEEGRAQARMEAQIKAGKSGRNMQQAHPDPDVSPDSGDEAQQEQQEQKPKKGFGLFKK